MYPARPSIKADRMLEMLIYVSQSNLPPEKQQREIENIVEVANARNRNDAITGLLVFTGGRFAQILEGPPEILTTLMDDIQKDVRHRDVTVVRRQEIRARSFSEWAMGYSGPSLVVDRLIKPLLHAGDWDERAEERTDSLADLMLGLRSQLKSLDSSSE
jgi:hypothetical protein